ncbi:hypothetical protein A2U01_0070372, partial [Trifolium medium]|nr:hypothetical protein [Trifolium medium]
KTCFDLSRARGAAPMAPGAVSRAGGSGLLELAHGAALSGPDAAAWYKVLLLHFAAARKRKKGVLRVFFTNIKLE